jgi:hypothetical protein
MRFLLTFPFLARWPGHIPVGADSDHLVCLTDMLATVAELCGAPLNHEDHPDSASLLSVLLQKSNEPVRDTLVTLMLRRVPDHAARPMESTGSLSKADLNAQSFSTRLSFGIANSRLHFFIHPSKLCKESRSKDI